MAGYPAHAGHFDPRTWTWYSHDGRQTSSYECEDAEAFDDSLFIDCFLLHSLIIECSSLHDCSTTPIISELLVPSRTRFIAERFDSIFIRAAG